MTVDGKMQINFTSVNFVNNPPKRMDDIVYGILQDDKYGYIWIVTFTGMQTIRKEADGGYFLQTNDYKLNDIKSKLFHDIYKDRQGNIWLGTVGEGVYNLDFNKLSIQNFTLGNLKQSLNTESFVTRLCDANNGNLYVVINRYGMVNFNIKTGDVSKISNPALSSFHSISSIINLQKTNEIWIANEGEDKIHIFKQIANGNDLLKTNQFSIKISPQFPDISITNLFEDFDGNVWIGSTDALFKKSPSLPVHFISDKIRVFAAFVPVDDENTVIYIRYRAYPFNGI